MPINDLIANERQRFQEAINAAKVAREKRERAELAERRRETAARLRDILPPYLLPLLEGEHEGYRMDIEFHDGLAHIAIWQPGKGSKGVRLVEVPTSEGDWLYRITRQGAARSHTRPQDGVPVLSSLLGSALPLAMAEAFGDVAIDWHEVWQEGRRAFREEFQEEVNEELSGGMEDDGSMIVTPSSAGELGDAAWIMDGQEGGEAQ